MQNDEFQALLGQPGTGKAFFRAGAIVLALVVPLAAPTSPATAAARTAGQDAQPIKNRNIDVSRAKAAKRPRREHDQALVNGWPLYRSQRGQTAFNQAMATLQATDGASPAAAAFKGCSNLACNLVLPVIEGDGWIPPGRIWLSPKEYVLIVHSPRRRRGKSYRRRRHKSMKYFVFHEFQNSTFNTDPYDTISAHSGSVFVPFYMSKKGRDATGRHYVVVVQVAPYDVRSIHASNRGSNGPGIEVAKNTSGALEPLQGRAGILIATMVKTAAPHLRVVHHRGAEGRPMLNAYKRALAKPQGRGRVKLVLPFVPAPRQLVARATGRLGDMITRPGVSSSPRIRLAKRRRAVQKTASRAPRPPTAIAASIGMSPLAVYLRANIATLKRLPDFATLIPQSVAAIGEVSPENGVVYLLDASEQILGRIEPHEKNGAVVSGKYVYRPSGRTAANETPFQLDFSKPVSLQLASLTPAATAPYAPTLIGPIQRAKRPALSAEPRLVEPLRPAIPPGRRPRG